MKQALIDYIKRGTNDELYTPNEAIVPIIKYLDDNNFKTVWECTDYGSSKITEMLRERGFTVITSHTNTNKSFFDEFLERAYELNKPFMMLLPITAFEGIVRGKLFRENGVEVLVFDKRINFMKEQGKKGAWFNTSWFCNKVLPEKLIFHKLIL